MDKGKGLSNNKF